MQNLRALMERTISAYRPVIPGGRPGGVIEEQIREADRNMYEDKAKYTAGGRMTEGKDKKVYKNFI